MTYKVEIATTPLGGVLACMAVEDGEKALATDACKVHDKGMGVFHGSATAFVI